MRIRRTRTAALVQVCPWGERLSKAITVFPEAECAATTMRITGI
jgi:hypothetical protein